MFIIMTSLQHKDSLQFYILHFSGTNFTDNVANVSLTYRPQDVALTAAGHIAVISPKTVNSSSAPGIDIFSRSGQRIYHTSIRTTTSRGISRSVDGDIIVCDTDNNIQHLTTNEHGELRWNIMFLAPSNHEMWTCYEVLQLVVDRELAYWTYEKKAFEYRLCIYRILYDDDGDDNKVMRLSAPHLVNMTTPSEGEFVGFAAWLMMEMSVCLFFAD